MLHPAFLYHSDIIPSKWEMCEGVRQRFVTGNGMNYTSPCNNTSSKRLISDRLCQQVLPGEAQAEQAQTCMSLHFHSCLLDHLLMRHRGCYGLIQVMASNLLVPSDKA